MTSSETLYAELKPEIAVIADHLFDVSELLLKKHGNFLPHAAVLTDGGEVKIVAAAPPNDSTNSAEVLPLLRNGLRRQARDTPLKAIGIAENVKISLEGQRSTKAIKVLFEHRRGLTVALYLPFEKKLLRGFVLGSIFSRLASPEVCAWSDTAA